VTTLYSIWQECQLIWGSGDSAAAITPAITQPTDVAALFAARCAQVPGALVAFALDQPQAQPLKVSRG